MSEIQCLFMITKEVIQLFIALWISFCSSGDWPNHYAAISFTSPTLMIIIGIPFTLVWIHFTFFPLLSNLNSHRSQKNAEYLLLNSARSIVTSAENSNGRFFFFFMVKYICEPEKSVFDFNINNGFKIFSRLNQLTFYEKQFEIKIKVLVRCC